MKIKTLVAAIALVAAGSANASINRGADSAGELFLSVFDPSAQQSYALDLGVTTADFLANPSAALSFNLSADANYSSFVGQTDLRWSVVGADNSFTDPATYGFMTTSVNTAASINATYGDQPTIGGRNLGISTQGLNANASMGDNSANYAVNLSGVAQIGEIGYYDVATWGDTLGNSGFVAATDVDSSMAFFHAGISQVDYYTAVIAEMAGVWTLTSAGQLTYAEVSAVPVPAAVWLFGSGLVGLVGVARRKAK